MMGIIIEQGGFLTTVQDLGRFGYQIYGVGVAGAMDRRSLKIANLLVGNPVGEAVLEVTIMGPVIKFEEDTIIAITGGNISPMLNGKPLSMYCAVSIKKGDVLKFSGLKTGCRSYIAFAGGIDVPKIMGSKSTYLRCNFGGYEGRALKKGDKINIKAPKTNLPNFNNRFVSPDDFSSNEITLRVIRGPQDDYFTKKGINTFFTSTYTVSDEADRMGVRLTGEIIEHVEDGNMISDGIAFGSIQVPSNGQPIIVLADRQTTGGYTKIATVASFDLPLIGQAKPGVKIKFKEISIEEAQQIYLEECAELRELEKRLNRVAMKVKSRRELTITIEGIKSDVIVEEVEYSV